ncbi:uncharacterized protein LOC143150566 isoform X4 [Ptiloglossa arizonensis]|uniref:uncharacterized protein LOC143150566 isoform X4 n=1 Tax=Ptiloglossa arizonensis TaxID=3350558 RepID=UPI003F9FB204
MGKRESVRRDARCIVEASRMISRLDRFIVFLVVLGVVGFARAIYDPREATTKPPIRREPVLPWYLAAKDDVHPSEDPSRSPKWQTDPDNPIPKKPFVVDAGTWDSQSPWSGIEQETETTDDNQAHINVDQGKDYSLEYSEFERQENQRFPSKAGGSRDLEQKKNRGYTKNKIKKQGTKNDQDIYEGVPADSMKPRKEKILQSSKSKSTVARYDPKLGVQCPDLDSTGQFVYPPDCKFFVNCWKGRAFVQTCAPGTLFNPDTLECDFPHKVKCYGGEVAEFPSIGHLDSSGRREPLLPDSQRLREHGKLQEPRCPPQMSGLLPHPSNCTKFLQCAHGGTFIMDCGPGTVFNPAVSVCDWPYNVKGCEDALKPKTVTTSPLIPPQYQPYDQKGSEYNKQPVKKVECPSDYTGLLPHPDTCKQFLQCANGVTYIMDCGPGTAFNPSISVCDWPYNVPGCSEETPTTTTPRPWSSGSETGPWQYNPQHNQTWHSQVNRPVTTTSPPKTDWDSLRPTWRPNWSPNTRTTQKPSETNQNWNPNAWKTDPPPQNRYDHVSRDKNDNNSPTQWPHNHGTSDQNPNYDGRYHQHHHYHHFHPHGSDRNIETQQPSPPYDNTQTQIPGQANPDGTWHSSPRYHHHEHHHWSDDKPPSPPNYPTEFDDSDQQTQQVTFDQTDNQRGVSDSEVNHTSNRNVRFDLGNLPANQRTGQEFMPNRQAYGRTDPEFSESGVNRQIPPDRNIYFDNNYDPAAVTNSRNTPGSWNQQGPGQSQTGPQNRPWDKDEPPFPTYYVPPVEPLDPSKAVYQTTPISGQVVRLRGGSGSHDGYVEVQGTNPGWGVVCDSRNSWTLKEAHVVCKQLGYSRGAEMAWQGRNNRVGTPTWIAANSVSCQGNETRLQLCKFTHEPQCRVERDAIGVRCALNRIAHCRKDEIPYEGQCYHLANPDSSLNHAEALDYCSQRQARLVDITNQAENDFISEWLVQGHPNVTSIMTSGIGFTTINHTIWLWEDSSRAKFRFAKWWPGWMEDKKHPPIVGSRILCVVMKRKFPCHNRPDSICVADYFFWDTEDCVTSMKGHSYICKRPYDDIGCIYGKGSQYAGNANVTASGKQCLSWADEKVRHPLLVNVVNVDVREKLKTHNYCRNLNPKRESRPWCFTGPAGEREYCDIPPCGNIVGSPKSVSMGQCKPKHFECLPGECIPSPWVCDGEEDCTNGADERACISYTNLYKKYSKHKLQGYDVEKWLNTPLNTCALRCKEADFTCRSFTHQSAGNVCLLSDSNVGMTGALKPDRAFDYYEMTDRSIDCEGMFVCGNGKCINQTKVCNGKNDCNDRSDENICTVENLDYAIRLAGSENKYEGRIEVKILGVWGQVCDDGFGMINADVICKELGFDLGALEIRPGGFYGNLDPPTRFMVDQLQCRGNETSLRECDFEGWGVHNCQPEEAVGIICKTEVDSCPDDQWKCKTIPTCISVAFICDEVVDCADDSDESPEYCDAPFEVRLANGSSPLEGRVEVRHHGIWGTVCDDDFLNTAATVICRSLGYGGPAVAKKDGAFGSGEGPIWLDEVSCHGNETQLYRCAHNDWGKHNCNHNEDVGVICTRGSVNDPKLHWESLPDLPDTDIDDILPANCGKRFKDFNDDEDLIFEKVVHGTIAPKGTYPWQASIRIRGHSRSSHWCGAVILSPLHVLTAAHCLDGYNKGAYFVRAGDYNTEIDEGTEAEANIEDYYLHDEFRKGHRMNNDIALVLLKGRGIALGKDIMPICLPAENAEYPAGLNCTISGFGSIETGKSTHSKDLRYGWVPLLDQSVCRAEHIYGEGAISDGMVCAGYLDEGTDTCDGDSGGPLACYHNGAFTLYGITSWGKHCGKANKPGVYVRVSHYRRWINQKIRESLAGR